MDVRLPNLRASEAALLLPALEAINLSQLRERAASGGPIPSLITDIQRGLIRYQQRDPKEEWRTLREIYAHGGGDCEDLSAGVAAELQFWGFAAFSFPYRTRIPGLSHVVVWGAPYKEFLDPSRSAGMGSGEA